MSNVNALPLYKATLGVSTDEDLGFALTFTLADGVTPLPLTGIGFALSVGTVATLTSAAGGGLTIAGAASNILSVFWPASSKTDWLGVYPLGLAASDGSYTREVFQGATSSLSVYWGASSPIALQQVASPSQNLLSAVNAVPGAETAALAAITSAFAARPNVVTDSTITLPGPGWWLIETAGAVLTLPDLSAGGPVVITDATGSFAPNIQIVGTVNGDAGGLLLTARGQSVTLGAGSNSWWMQ
ncbi:hypothetical protein DFR50_14239 [Roseiarcus fermentans]|uniref:Uncharacterized protein n=1 Tax=Roseiarcus fermentans TaxID=1473586 RepID=A0A366EN54_9HYPH|nr:hypothetical protein [Roseiarcus fermentans]RBP03791.1 hypothetical protein DFR50_14239 [Roseiarcus fermentans]